ncbi:MAG: exopolyphosphatase [Thermodesulfobacteriota bacterium]
METGMEYLVADRSSGDNMRICTRGDLDGMTSSVLLTIVEEIDRIRFVHPKDVQDGLVTVTHKDILVNLPYAAGCGMWFDHHISEKEKSIELSEFKGRFEIAPSCARVIYNHYQHPAFESYNDLLRVTDKIDSARLTMDEVANPAGLVLLGYTLDPRTGLGDDFREYFCWLVGVIREIPLSKVLEFPEVKERCQRFLDEQENCQKWLGQICRLEDNVIITDMRKAKKAPVGNRFLVYTLFPEGNVEIRIVRGLKKNIVLIVGRSIFNKTCRVNIGKMLSRYGGGGHEGAGTCQLLPKHVNHALKEIINQLKRNDNT